ncbi:NUDIX hydrolase [Thiocystis violacea]|uniref:NUDIX hydrolase n=1 Tax=Thiocystis violacea TaxID=13725 RepID=UPI001908F060|nr:NUDIX hydrolase [Thiocystis violacea]MBK1724954.1 hypothetical protein [Thiocystis violacea]
MYFRTFKALPLATQLMISAAVQHVTQVSGVSESEAALIVMTCQRLFDSLALLDRRLLHAGQWQFVSFPAQLVARSLLSALADEDQDFFECRYWEQGAHRPEDVVEAQRTLLRGLETARVASHRRSAPKPIRFVYVAWGVIRLDGRFLLHHREDKARRQTGNYVLPGGRFNLSDLPVELQTPQGLPLTQRTESTEALSSLERTLVRELAEEIQLRHPEHYSFRPWRQLRPFREVEGARNNHAYTEYLIRVFEVTLNASGHLRLLETLSDHPEQFAWFSPEDLMRKVRRDGKVAYLEALHADLGGDLKEALEGVAESFVDRPTFEDETGAVDVPMTGSSSLMRGRTGKERAVAIDLSDDDQAVLLALAWYAKGLAFSSVDGVVLLPSGWVKVIDDRCLRSLDLLSEKLHKTGLDLIDCRDERFFRLSVAPGMVFFDVADYRYDAGPADGVMQRDGWFRLWMPSRETPFGCTAEIEHTFQISRNTLRIIESVEAVQDPEQNTQIKSGDIQRVIREQIDTRTKPLGLRKFLRIEGKEYSISVERLCRDS